MPETPLSNRSVYSARPTVRINQQEYPKVSELLIGMEMVEQEGGMSSLELRVSNVASNPQGGADLAFEDDQILKLGAAIAIYSGDENAPREIFQGIITALEAEFPEESPPELVVLAEDVFQQARMARRTQIHENVTIADLSQQLASSLGLTPIITGFTRPIGTQVQINESDLAFLRRILSRYDGDVQIVGRELHVSPRSDVQRGTVELALHRQLRMARVLADLAHQVTEVTVSGWDAGQGQRICSRSRGSHLGQGGGRTGAQVLQSTIGDRSHHIGHLAIASNTEAQAVADAAFDHRARQFLCIEATAEGNPAIRVGTQVRLTGMGDRFDNTYYVVKACHRYGVIRGYETDFSGECAYWGAN
ncbi:phage late control D family protein [Leptolyngbya ohadii]|uniref:phage late control D family protein n=1 Tax=Leptolyngbya ohadii TaxID=1962290 RepID=UPI000B59B8F5|nr:contractile injection system protein, VgrG/Pvc8 family [Leptolyngbya ohadii]